MFNENSVALVTGAASGIGLATVSALRGAGVGHFVLVDMAPLSGTPDDLMRQHDVADPDAWTVTAQMVTERFARLDLAVVNAGVVDAAPIVDLAFDRWQRVMHVNLDGAFLTLQTALRLIGDGGSIVCSASAAALRGTAGNAAYSCSKAALIQLVKVAALEAAPRGIRVNAVAPGPVDTGIWRTMPMYDAMVEQAGSEEAMLDAVAASLPLARLSAPAEIAGHIVHLLSAVSASVTGTTMVIDGGWSA